MEVGETLTVEADDARGLVRALVLALVNDRRVPAKDVFLELMTGAVLLLSWEDKRHGRARTTEFLADLPGILLEAVGEWNAKQKKRTH